MNPWRVLSPDSPTRPRPEKHWSRLTGLRGGWGGPVRRHPRSARVATAEQKVESLMKCAHPGWRSVTANPRAKHVV